MPTFLNLACGGNYIKSADWENVDYFSDSKFVRKSNILENLKTSAERYDAIYCAHFVEHIPPHKLASFLARCRTLMKEDSIFRIVVPDTEFLLREYLKHKDEGNQLYADYAFVTFFDQCVRLRRGGKLGDYYRRIALGEMKELEGYSEYLNGPVAPEIRVSAHSQQSFGRNIRKLRAQPRRIWEVLELIYIRSICAFLPKVFREQNVSFAAVGEKHLWMYDFEGLKSALNQAGFSRVVRRSFNTSNRTDNIFLPLDELDGKPRKGNHQLFVEAQL
jgi:predicted SAM-dependent methyltransferase